MCEEHLWVATDPPVSARVWVVHIYEELMWVATDYQ